MQLFDYIFNVGGNYTDMSMTMMTPTSTSVSLRLDN